MREPGPAYNMSAFDLSLTQGLTAPEFVVTFLKLLKAIARVTFISYPIVPNFEDRVRSRAVNRSTELVIRNAIVHFVGGRELFTVNANDVSVDLISALHARAPGNAIGLTSIVETTSGDSRHIPMMDLKCDVSRFNQGAVASLFKSIGELHGALLQSGQSYHYYGARLADEKQWRIFLGQCLLFSPVVDSRYIGHRLIDGYCVLRVSGALA